LQYVYASVSNIPEAEGSIGLRWVGPDTECGICLDCKLNRGKNIYLGLKMGTVLLLILLRVSSSSREKHPPPSARVFYCLPVHSCRCSRHCIKLPPPQDQASTAFVAAATEGGRTARETTTGWWFFLCFLF